MLQNALIRIPQARLYTKFIPAEREYRVHIVNGRAIVVHRKVEGTGDIRNSDAGWVFRRVTTFPDAIIPEARNAVVALGLDFAAVDVLWDGQRAYVLETNTAPGIDGMEYTLRMYVQALERLVNNT